MVDRGSTAWQLIPTWSKDSRDSNAMRFLTASFVPGKWDVICHSGKESQQHIGNRRFSLCIQNHLKSYAGSNSRPARSAIITNVVASIRDVSEGGFVRLDLASGRWYEVGDKMARDKVGQALRDAMNSDTQERSMSPPQEQRKRKRPSCGGSNSPNTKQNSTPDTPKQMEKTHIALDINPRHNAWPNSNEMPMRLNPPFTTGESRVQTDSLRIVREPTDSGFRDGKVNDANNKCFVSVIGKSTEATATATVKAKGQAKADQSPGDASGNSGRSSTSDSHQLSLIEWFEKDVQNAPL
ncbi:unnamed protein product [Cylindrotheca closterium]|uniref:DUF6824 domain-containing protein n=1 Tax=Cylindrotheca closterium TaxID=2856 RepID=A0AAD2G1S1_9STRA|nr:unnamed protein product [Cylindrotheca closterium]